MPWATEQCLSVVGPWDRDRFFEARDEESGEWLVLDAKRHPPRVMCKCLGWNAPKNAALIVAALEAHNSELYAKTRARGFEAPLRAAGRQALTAVRRG